MNNEIENINDEIDLFFNNIQQINQKKEYNNEYKNYEEILSDEEQLKIILENCDKKSILKLKNTHSLLLQNSTKTKLLEL